MSETILKTASAFDTATASGALTNAPVPPRGNQTP